MKHPHRLLFFDKKTWKCTLPGCNFFVHSGLKHILLGKTAVCWECGEQFTVDEYALQDDMPKCAECRGMIPRVEVEQEEEMSPERRKLFEELGLIKKGKKQ